MFQWQIKICGVTNSIDAAAAALSGAGAVGLNFHPRSLRCVTPDEADLIVQALPARVARIGVFVNASLDSIASAIDLLSLNAVQLHGDETPEVIRDIPCPVIRAVRVNDEQFESAFAEIGRWIEGGVEAILLDADSRTEYGGTGKRLNWRAVADLRIEVPIVLAGGLNCDNVQQAIAMARPAAVDVATGIESFPGRKDSEQMRRFVTLATQAFAAI